MSRPVAIVQSFEGNAPRWIWRCVDSVRAWAAQKGFEYRISPTFFDRVPPWFAQKCAPEKGPLTDLARLCLMQELFDEGAEFVAWVDADVLVFDPQAFDLACGRGFTVIEEVTILVDGAGGASASPRGVNGAVLGAARDNPMFARYREAVESVVRDHEGGRIPRTIAGPRLLTRLTEGQPVDRLTSVGLFTPAILTHIANGRRHLPRFFAERFGHPVAAANLCHFFREEIAPATRAKYDAVMEAAIDRLLASRGEVVNRYVR